MSINTDRIAELQNIILQQRVALDMQEKERARYAEEIVLLREALKSASHPTDGERLS